MLKREANVRVHQVLHLCLLLLVCAQCSSMWVTWLGSKYSHHFKHLLKLQHSPLTLRFSFQEEQGSWSLASFSFSISVLSSPNKQSSLKKQSKSHPLYPFPSFVQGWVHVRGWFHVCVAWINIRGFKLPFSWLGSSQACVFPRTGVSQVMCRQWVSSKRTGREQGCKSGPKSYSPHVSWSFMIKWVQVSMERINKQSNRNKRVLFEPSWAL